MLNLFNQFKKIFFDVLQEIAKKNNVEILAQDFENFIIEPAKEKSHGDLACNIAMTLSKRFSGVESLNNPRKLAQEIIAQIGTQHGIVKLEIAGPGFINIFLQNQVFHQILGELLVARNFIFDTNLGRGEKVNLEYASPNPTGPIHVGHTRGAIYGDVLANLLKKVGFVVLKEYYVNDAGSQIDKLVDSAMLRYLEAINKIQINDGGNVINIDGEGALAGVIMKLHPNIGYPGDYLGEIGKKLQNIYLSTTGEIIYDDFEEKSQEIEEELQNAQQNTIYDYFEEKFNEIKRRSQNVEEVKDVYANSTEYMQPEWENLRQKIRDFVVDEMLKIIIEDLAALGIKHDSIFSEKKELHDTNSIEKVIEFLKNKKDEAGNFIIYRGKLEVPKTEKGVGAKDFKLPEGYDEKDQLLFRSTLFGDDIDRVIQKSDGSYTYFAADLAYIKSKFERGATKFIMPLGFDHAGYVKRLTAATKIITDDKAHLKVILCQMVKFIKNGEPLKMSKRAGNFIAARDVIDQLNQELGAKSVDKQNKIDENEITAGAAILRFIMLTRKNDTPFDFDLAKVVEQSKDNPIFYVQYAHARCCSVLRNLKADGLLPNIESSSIDLSVLQNLQDESELEIIKKIVAFPRIIEMAVTNYEPHRIAFYLQELAATFHALWNKGVENPNLKFIIPNNLEITKSRMYLLMAIKIIIAAGLDVFNIKALEELR